MDSKWLLQVWLKSSCRPKAEKENGEKGFALQPNQLLFKVSVCEISL